MRILVVDDSLTMRRIVVNALKIIGFNDVLEAEDGQRALEIIQNDHIEFIISDWNMPNMSGLELTNHIRTDDKYKHLPILMVTTRGLKEDIIQALKAKVNNYIVKPFTPQILKEKIDLILSVAKNN